MMPIAIAILLAFYMWVLIDADKACSKGEETFMCKAEEK